MMVEGAMPKEFLIISLLFQVKEKDIYMIYLKNEM